MRSPKQIALKLAESQKDDLETAPITFSSQFTALLVALDVQPACSI